MERIFATAVDGKAIARNLAATSHSSFRLIHKGKVERVVVFRLPLPYLVLSSSIECFDLIRPSSGIFCAQLLYYVIF